MASLSTWLNAAKGSAGKALTTVGTALNAPQIKKGGLGAIWQSQAGYALSKMNPFNPPSANAQVQSTPSYDYSKARSIYTPTPQVLGDKTINNGGGGGGNGGGGNSGGGPSGQDVIDQNANDQNGIIDRDYEMAMSELSNQEQTLQGQGAEASGTLTNESAKVANQIQNQKAVDISGTEAQLATGESEAKSATQQARDLFRQTQQNNIAQLSGMGISSSSVAEALAERLGVETARRIAGVTGSLSEIRQNATKELSRIKSYYEGKVTEMTDWVANEKLKIQNSLAEGLRNINQGRQVAAAAKANARASLLSEVRSQVFSLQQQEQQFQQSLKQWAAQKEASTKQLVTDPASVLAYNQNIARLNETPGITQTSIGNYGTTDEGQLGFYKGPLKTSVKDEEDDWRNTPTFTVQ